MTRFQKIKSIFLILFCFSFQPFFAEVIQDSDFGFILDVPEVFKIANYSNDGLSYIFEHSNIPVTLAMKIYNNENLTKKNQDNSKIHTAFIHRSYTVHIPFIYHSYTSDDEI